MNGGVEVWSHRQMMCKVGMKQSQRADSVSQLMVRWNRCRVQSVGSRYERRGEERRGLWADMLVCSHR